MRPLPIFASYVRIIASFVYAIKSKRTPKPQGLEGSYVGL